MDWPPCPRGRTAPWLTALCTTLTLLGCSAAASARVPDPASNFPEQIPPVCNATPGSVACTQAGIAELDLARAWEGQAAYQLPPDFLSLSGAHQMFVLTNLDREADGERTIPGTTAALDHTALLGAAAGTDPVLHDPSVSWTANWAGGFPGVVWAYLTWMYDDGYGGPNVDCPAPGDRGCWGHRDDILARFARGGTLEMGAAEVNGDSYAMIIAQSLPDTPVRYTYRFVSPTPPDEPATVRRAWRTWPRVVGHR